MTVAGDVPAANVVLDLKVADKAALLRELGRIAERLAGGLPAATVTAALVRREALGSTGLGHGFALPHASLDGLDSFVVVLVRLARPIPFDAVDDAPVDVACMLLTPAAGDDHVRTLAAYSRIFRNKDRLRLVRTADSPEAAVAGLVATPDR